VLVLLSVRPDEQTGGLLVLLAVEEVHLADVEELQAVQVAIDMGLADDGLELVLLLLGVTLSIGLVLLGIDIGPEVNVEVLSPDESELLQGRVEHDLIPANCLVGLQFFDLAFDEIVL
jgi:hypothetical protein